MPFPDPPPEVVVISLSKRGSEWSAESTAPAKFRGFSGYGPNPEEAMKSLRRDLYKSHPKARLFLQVGKPS